MWRLFPPREKAAVPFAIAILIVWAVVAGFSLVGKDYTEITVITPVMLLAAGFIFGIGKKNGDSNK